MMLHKLTRTKRDVIIPPNMIALTKTDSNNTEIYS